MIQLKYMNNEVLYMITTNKFWNVISSRADKYLLILALVWSKNSVTQSKYF